MRRAICAFALLALGACNSHASDVVAGPDDAIRIGRDRCGNVHAELRPGEAVPKKWQARRDGNVWFAWLAHDGDDPGNAVLGAQINAKDGNLVSCVVRMF